MPQPENPGFSGPETTAPAVRYETYDGEGPRIVLGPWPESQGDYTSIRPEDVPYLVAALVRHAGTAVLKRPDHDGRIGGSIIDPALGLLTEAHSDGLVPPAVVEIPMLIREPSPCTGRLISRIACELEHGHRGRCTTRALAEARRQAHTITTTWEQQRAIHADALAKIIDHIERHGA